VSRPHEYAAPKHLLLPTVFRGDLWKSIVKGAALEAKAGELGEEGGGLGVKGGAVVGKVEMEGRGGEEEGRSGVGVRGRCVQGVGGRLVSEGARGLEELP
jgi:hypothetical protein